uniref:Uncharacterized protein n=1 Tax=Lotus japonicus TaxID=34305 RepID=I3T8V3_LOTJA|nr:unknown [Lotus japonicus]
MYIMASVVMVPFQTRLLKKHVLRGHCHTKSASYPMIRNEKKSSFRYRSTVDVPLYELPGASFDQYMDDKSRVFRTMFPDQKTMEQLNEEEWRIKMPPIQFLFWSFHPAADVRLSLKSNGEDYPPNIPHHVTKIIELNFVGAAGPQ